jgi:site-specific recombinase XerD
MVSASRASLKVSSLVSGFGGFVVLAAFNSTSEPPAAKKSSTPLTGLALTSAGTIKNGLDRVPPKTPRSQRLLPLPQVVAEALKAHMAEFPPSADGSLFTTAQGNLYRQEHYQARIFRPAARAAKLPAGTTTHDLRHHFASVLLNAGESVVAVAEALGHENATLVLKTYGHLMPDSEDRMRRAVDGAWASGRQITDKALG